MKIPIMHILFALTAFVCQACFFDKSHDNCEALKAYHASKNQMLTIFANKSLFKRGNGIILEVNKGRLRNSFFLRKKLTDERIFLELTNDSLEFRPVLDVDFFKSNRLDEDDIEKAVVMYASHLLAHMDSLNITDFRSDFSHLGIDLEFYFKDKSRLIYISNLDRVINPEWRRFINKANKIDQNWYHCPPD